MHKSKIESALSKTMNRSFCTFLLKGILFTQNEQLDI